MHTGVRLENLWFVHKQHTILDRLKIRKSSAVVVNFSIIELKIFQSCGFKSFQQEPNQLSIPSIFFWKSLVSYSINLSYTPVSESVTVRLRVRLIIFKIDLATLGGH